jgi:demethylmenaquinone methyltransferase/2-methoxy-6-polyprenyl-1,4-benzoquinol methylase
MSKGIQKIFADVPQTYEFLNHVLTFGQDILWRKRAARAAAAAGGTLWLDACSGTGETAAYLAHLAGDDTGIVVADFSLPMMSKALNKPEAGHITFTLADVSRLPFRDNSFDAITISFATRNINLSKNNLIKCFQEFYRILKPGGLFVNLETSQPEFAPIRWIFHTYIELAVRPIGRLVSGSDAAYAYLSYTIPRFYSSEELADVIRQAGFPEVTFDSMLFGVAAIHRATK